MKDRRLPRPGGKEGRRMITPLRILSLGAGVQSSTVLRMAIHGEIEKLDHCIFADTGWEPRAVYQHLKFLRAEAIEAGIGFHIVQAKPGANIRNDIIQNQVNCRKQAKGAFVLLDDGPVWEQVPNRIVEPEDAIDEGDEESRLWRLRNRKILGPDTPESIGHFASMPFFTRDRETGSVGLTKRQCTSNYKLDPIRRMQRRLAGIHGKRCQELAVVVVVGISADEMQRMRSSVEPWQAFAHPLIDLNMDRLACIAWNRKHGYPDPPRSACIGCPFHSDREWRDMQKNRPEEFADAVEFDASIRKMGGMRGDVFLHRSCKPLDQIDFRTDADKGQLDMFQQECLGLCGD